MEANHILYIAYPLLTVSETSAGGAEQVLWTLEREVARRGMNTTVAASSGSRVSGELFATGEPCTRSDDFERRNREHQDAIIAFVRQRSREGRPFDLVHDMSGSFWSRATAVDIPVLSTLHLPRHFYSATLFESVARNVTFNCVSESQAASFAEMPQLVGVVHNGIDLDRFQPNYGHRNGLLWLGRICEEKGPHIALDIAEQADLPIVLAGQVYPFSYHQQYFEREIRPRLEKNSNAKWIESPSDQLKRDLLREASTLLITSQVDETSSLVAMEAAASGTPVIAFHRGALPEVVEHGVTGLLLNSVQDAVEALSGIAQIKSEACRQHAARSFSSAHMAKDYLSLYARVRKGRPSVAA